MKLPVLNELRETSEYFKSLVLKITGESSKKAQDLNQPNRSQTSRTKILPTRRSSRDHRSIESTFSSRQLERKRYMERKPTERNQYGVRRPVCLIQVRSTFTRTITCVKNESRWRIVRINRERVECSKSEWDHFSWFWSIGRKMKGDACYVKPEVMSCGCRRPV